MSDLRERALAAYRRGQARAGVKLASLGALLVVAAIAVRAPVLALAALLLVPARRLIARAPRGVVPVNVVMCVLLFAGFARC